MESHQEHLRFVVDDQRHCQHIGRFKSYGDAKLAIVGFVSNRWDEEPNRAPCRNWETCGRDYQIIEVDTDDKFLKATLICKISCDGAIWFD